MMRTLYRPVGLTEMKLILDLNLKAFPPRLPEQPIFYPVLNKQYADQIASEWNTKDRFSGSALGSAGVISRERIQADISAPANCPSAAGSFESLRRWDVVNTRTLEDILNSWGGLSAESYDFNWIRSSC